MTNQSKTYLIAGLGILIIIGLVWWKSYQKPQTVGQAPIKIGGAFSLSGFAAEWGQAERNAVTMAFDEINQDGGVNGQPLELVVEDITSDGSKVVTAVQKLLNVDNMKVIIGPTWLDSFAGAVPLSDQYQALFLTPSASLTSVEADKDHPYIFSTWFSTQKMGQDVVAHWARQGQTRVALFVENEPYYEDVANQIKAGVAADPRVQIVKEYKVNSNDKDFRTPLLQLKAAQPDVVFFGFANENQLLLFLKQRAEIYPEATLYANESIEPFTAKDNYRPLLNEVHFIAAEVSIPKFQTAYKERFGIEPVLSAANAYDAAHILAQALQAGKTSPTDIKEYLSITSFNTITFGRVTFDKLGAVQGGKYQFKVIRNGVVTVTND